MGSRPTESRHDESSHDDPSRPISPTPGKTRRASRWFSWIFGFAILGAVIVGALHFAEEREFVETTKNAQPWWLVVAVFLQVGTYLAQGGTWRVVLRRAKVSVPLVAAFKLSLAKLFIDQALPSAGISGTVVVARSLERRGVSRAVVMATVVVDSVSYYGAYVLTLAVALIITIARGHASPLIVAAALCFVAYSAALAAAALVLSGRRRAAPVWLMRVPLLKDALALVGQADARLAHSRSLILTSGAFQLAIFLLDASTVWVLIRSLGDVASPTGVFASFMISSLMRTIGIIPGGLGTFEAASVVTLKLAGVPVTIGLAATLLFRGLSFWLPMAPGLVFSRHARKAA